jgi:hypothetical protein
VDGAYVFLHLAFPDPRDIACVETHAFYSEGCVNRMVSPSICRDSVTRFHLELKLSRHIVWGRHGWVFSIPSERFGIVRQLMLPIHPTSILLQTRRFRTSTVKCLPVLTFL